jgi:starvation-inducible DNA-binding protein
MALTTQDDVALALERAVTDLIALGLVAKQAHWNVEGPSFRNLHLLLDELADVAREGGDLVAERSMSLGHNPDGRPETVAMNNPFASLPAGPLRDTDVVPLFSEILADMRTRLRAGIDITASDPVTQGILIGVAEQLDKLGWMIGAHGGGRQRERS